MSQSEPAVLIVDDEASVRETLAEFLSREGMVVQTVPDGASAVEKSRETEFDVVIVDLLMPGISGLETIRTLKKLSPDTEMIIFTGHATLESSIEAFHEQVFDYVRKPEMKALVRTAKRATERRRLIRENRELMRQLELERNGLQKQVEAAKRALERRLANSPVFVGESEAIAQVRRFIAEVAASDMTVLLRGESGTGKDVVARLIHESSGRDPSTFVKINCPAIPETLLESELFGHEPGAFTGADRRKPGRFEFAVGGTIFLDEIGDMPPSIQAKLLQVIEHKQFTRLGGNKTIHVETRVVAATNANIESKIASSQFRTDLFYRLNEYSIVVPSLRERVGDIPLLAEHFLKVHGQKAGKKNLAISPRTMAQLISYSWPGNVRELESIIRRYALTGREETLLAALGQSQADTSALATPVATSVSPDLLRQREIQTIVEALTQTRWNQRKAAKALGISYSSLRRRIAKYDLKNEPSTSNPNDVLETNPSPEG